LIDTFPAGLAAQGAIFSDMTSFLKEKMLIVARATYCNITDNAELPGIIPSMPVLTITKTTQGSGQVGKQRFLPVNERCK
jgi:hypothetical protein